MENFVNENIDITQLPKFEEVPFLSLQKSYWKVILINLFIVFLLLTIGLGFALLKIEELVAYQLGISIAFGLLILIFVFFSYLSFKKKGFAFREHDVLLDMELLLRIQL